MPIDFMDKVVRIRSIKNKPEFYFYKTKRSGDCGNLEKNSNLKKGKKKRLRFAKILTKN